MSEGMEKKVYRILTLNFGSTSSKLACFENDVCRAASTLSHPAKELAPRVAWRLAGGRVPAFSVDPPTIDEFSPLARYTGLPEITRKSRMQTLNQKATARRFAQDAGRPYEELNLIVIHMGGGISVAAHRHGKMVDANNGLDGDGPFASNRSGTLPAGDLIDMCYSGRYTHAECAAA